MQSYLVETYLPGSLEVDACAAGGSLRDAAQAMTRESTPVRYIRTTLLPGDETCFHVVEADSKQTVEELTRRVGLGHARVVRAIELSRARRPRAR